MLSSGPLNRTRRTAVAHLHGGGESSRCPVVLPLSIKSPSLRPLLVRCLDVERRSWAPEVSVVLSISDTFVVHNIRDGEDVLEVNRESSNGGNY